MEVLAAFVREHSHEDRGLSIQPDVQAAVTVVGRRISRRDRGHIDLSGADLSGADLSDADLTDADLSDANLYGANLTGADCPANTPVPKGWKKGPAFFGLVRACADSEPTQAN